MLQHCDRGTRSGGGIAAEVADRRSHSGGLRQVALMVAWGYLCWPGHVTGQAPAAKTRAPAGGGAKSFAIQLTAIRTIDGTNSGVNPQAGAAGTVLLRRAPADYPGDGTGEELWQAPERANPRTISNLVCAQSGSIVNRRQLSDFIWAWGQFLDHDLSLTETAVSNGTAFIAVDDPQDLIGPNPIPFSRSNFTLTSASGTREQINSITAFIDGSNVYGSSAERAIALRAHVGGRLKVSAQDMPPFNDLGLPNAPSTAASFYLLGDIRANENVVLTCLHTLFVREHNRLCELIAVHVPNAGDEEIYQLVRKIVGAELQIITYREFLPALLGSAAPRLQAGLGTPQVDAGVTNEFSTAFYRVGHTLLSSRLILAHQGRVLGGLPLQEAFLRPEYLANDPFNFDRLLGGLQLQHAQNIDTRVVNDVRNFLFGPPGAGGLDLASLNIQRGRDHGLPDYNTLRAVYGMPKVRSFAAITHDQVLQTQLELLYGDVDNIDPWIGALSENHVPEIAVGPLMMLALREQFQRSLAGDRFNVLTDPDLRQPLVRSVISLDQITLADLVRRNSDYVAVNDDVFHALPPILSDVVVRYDATDNRLFVLGNRLANRVVLTQLSDRLMAVSGLGPTRVNGRQVTLLITRPKPSVTVDLGDGNDTMSVILCDLDRVTVSLGTGTNSISSFFSAARQAIYGATGSLVQYPAGGIPVVSR